MSDVFVRLIPPDPASVPPLEVRRKALAVLTDLLPRADEVREQVEDDPVFVDAGSNFERVICPGCDRTLDHEWWVSQMDQARATTFRDLHVVPPCCGARTTLNDLKYAWSQGFARYILEVRNPGTGNELFHEVLDAVSDALGFRPRVIWARV